MAEAEPTLTEDPPSDLECPQTLEAGSGSGIKTNLELHRAARKGRVGKLRKLCKAGVGPDVPNEQHQSPLFLAVLNDRKRAVECLLSCGADPNYACYDGSTPMHAACLACSPPILCLLADAGGNIRYHDNRGLLPRDWVSYQEDMHKRFKMRKFLEAMRLYAIGTIGDEKLTVSARSRWNAFMDYLRQFPERRQQRWRRRGWFSKSTHRRFRRHVPRVRLNVFQRLPSLSCSSWTMCWDMFGRHVKDVSERDTLPSTSAMKMDIEMEQGEETYINPEIEMDGCRLQLSDSTYPEQTLYIDEKRGTMTTTRMSPPRVTEPIIRRRRLTGIEEERTSEVSDVINQNKASTGHQNEESPASDLSWNVTDAGNHSQGKRKTRGAGSGSGKTTLIIHGVYTGDMGKKVALKARDKVGESGDIAATKDAEIKVKDENQNYQEFSKTGVPLEISREKTQKDEDSCQGAGSSRVVQEQDISIQHLRARHSSSSTDESCKNVFLDILDDAFKLELAPKVSELMADYCDSTQGSNAPPESFDFHSYHGDDTYDVDVDEAKWIGAGSSVSSDDHHNQYDQHDDRLDHHDNHDITSGQVKQGQEQSSNDASAQAEMDIDQLLLKTYMCDDDDEDDKNFVVEGRYLDVQKMLSANLEMVFPPEGAAQLDVNMNETKSEDDYPESSEDEGSSDSNGLSGLSSLYHVSALDEAALISDLPLEVNVNESRKSLDASMSPDLGGTHYATPCGGIGEPTAESENTKLRSALARMDLTTEQERRVQEWYGGHGSVQNLIRDYETRIHEHKAQDQTPRSSETSLGEVLRRQFADIVSRDEGVTPRRCISDSETMRRHPHGYPHVAMSDVKFTPNEEKNNSLPQANINQEASYDESWLWPGSADENETFEEELRKSMATVGLQSNNDDYVEGVDDRTPSERGDADKICRDSPLMVSPPPPTCTPEETPKSQQKIPENSAEASFGSRVDSSGDCEMSEGDPNEHRVVKPASRAESLTDQDPVTVPLGAAARADTSPQIAARKKLVAIDVMRSPTVEAVKKTTI